jgi:hypothetical protein
MPVNKGKVRIWKGNMKFSQLAGVGMSLPRFVRDGHILGHRRYKKGIERKAETSE